MNEGVHRFSALDDFEPDAVRKDHPRREEGQYKCSGPSTAEITRSEYVYSIGATHIIPHGCLCGGAIFAYYLTITTYNNATLKQKIIGSILAELHDVNENGSELLADLISNLVNQNLTQLFAQLIQKLIKKA